MVKLKDEEICTLKSPVKDQHLHDNMDLALFICPEPTKVVDI